jgi:tetratricopeptide (TPR) repeat protein
MQEASHGRAFGELAELLFLHARLQRAQGSFGRAADDLHACLQLLYGRAPNEDAIEPALRLNLFAQLATYEFFLEHYDVAMDFVKRASYLISRAPGEEMSAASALWVHAHLLRTRGLPERALYPALTAAEVHAREASLTSQDRIEVFVADVLLDMAEKVPGPRHAPDRLDFLAQAQTHLQQAERLAREAKDSPGATLVKLIQLRESRLRGRKEDRVRAIEACLRKGHRLHDEALLAQGYTLLGQEFASQGDNERAKNCWRETLHVLEHSEIPALRVPARRSLLRASEQCVD